MLYLLFTPLADDALIFNLFRYLTFRSGGAIFTALIICFIVGPKVIDWLKIKQKEGQPIREDGPESHLITKQGTPTMGGLMILLSLAISTLLWADISNPYVWIVLLITIGFGLVGFVDDYTKLTKRDYRGISSRQKMGLLFICSLTAALLVNAVSAPELSGKLAVPFFKDVLFDLGIVYTIFAIIVMLGASNAVNLTDGLDGLAIVPVMIAAGCFGLISYVVGHYEFSEHLQLHFVKGTGELAVFCAALIGAGMGFLWFNAPPAKVFMGDTGSLALGGALGVISVITKHEFVLAIIGGLFVIEALSVIIQVASFKLTGKRVFKMAPIHHHFEKHGWAEPTIVIRFWIISFIFALAGLATLKLR